MDSFGVNRPFSKGYAGKIKKISPRLETRPGCKSGVRRGVCWLGLRSCGGRFIIAQIIDEISYLRKILSMDSVILLGPALVSARMSERTTSTAYGPLKKRRPSGHVFALFALGCSLPANLDKAHKGGSVTVVAHQHRCGPIRAYPKATSNPRCPFVVCEGTGRSIIALPRDILRVHRTAGLSRRGGQPNTNPRG